VGRSVIRRGFDMGEGGRDAGYDLDYVYRIDYGF
jgi:hypothetical protein